MRQRGLGGERFEVGGERGVHQLPPVEMARRRDGGVHPVLDSRHRQIESGREAFVLALARGVRNA
jgi:hypothetical protein